MKEVWKPIKGFEGLYEISSLGNVKSFPKKNGRGIGWLSNLIILKPKTNKCGYLCVSLRKDKKPHHQAVHRLVAQAFLKNPENKPQVNHIDGNKKNNCVDNLEWNTSSENHKHAFRTGLKSLTGDKHNNRKICSKDVLFIRNSDKMGIELAEMFGISASMISTIKNRKSWKSV